MRAAINGPRSHSVHRVHRMAALLCLVLWSGVPGEFAAGQEDKANVIDFYGYDDCIQLTNGGVRVVLCPAAGGRVLEYSINGRNALYLPPGDEGWTWDKNEPGPAPMHAGRFDIGPEKRVPRRPTLWQGRWEGEITGPRSARLTSQKDAASGVQLVRSFELFQGNGTQKSTALKCTQTILNVSDYAVEYCHWSRTFAPGGGVCIVPTSKFTRFPNHYVRYDDAKSINYRPEDQHVQRRGDFLLISDHPQHPKLGFDSREGWLAYAAPSDLLLIKRFSVDSQRAYNEVAGLTISIWYPEKNLVELEPIGPAEHIEPGNSASFTEVWDLVEMPFRDAASVDLDAVEMIVDQLPTIPISLP